MEGGIKCWLAHVITTVTEELEKFIHELAVVIRKLKEMK